MKLKKIIVSLAATAVLGGSAIFSCLGAKGVQKVEATDDPIYLTSEEFKMTQIEHTVSDNSESFSYRFAASFTARTNAWAQVYLAVDDDTFVDGSQPEHSNPEEIPHYKGFIAEIEGTGSANEDSGHDGRSLIVIPDGVAMTTKYYIDSTKIKTGLMHAAGQYVGSFGIFIPSTVETIESGAFVNVPEYVSFYVEDETIKSTWAADWTDAPSERIHLGVNRVEHYNDLFQASFNLPSEASTEEEKRTNLSNYVMLRRTSNSKDITTGYNFAIGYVGETQYRTYDETTQSYKMVTAMHDLKLKVDYKIKRGGLIVDGTTVVLEPKNSSGKDVVGSSVGDPNRDISFNIDIEKGEEIVNDSVVIHGIYFMIKAPALIYNETTHAVEPDPNAPYIPDVDTGERYIKSSSLSNTVKFNDVTNFSNTSFVTYADYTQVNFEITNKSASVYQKYDKTTYDQYKARINRGEYYLRFRLVEIYNTKLLLKLQGESDYREVPLQTPIQYDYVIIGDQATGNKISFCFPNSAAGNGFSAEKIDTIRFKKLCFKVEIVKRDADTSNAEKNFRCSFGLVEVYNASASQKAPVTNLITILIIGLASYVGVFAIVTAFLYFYIKNKYKNDEFRRLKPKQFFITAAKNFVGYLLVVLAALYIIFRTALLNSKVVLFNPLDVFVIVFTIAAGIFIGFTIKNLVVGIKRNIDNKKKKKLHLDKDVVDDGTK